MMRRALGSVWFAVIGGMLAWSLRTIPPSPPAGYAVVVAVFEASLPPAHRLRPQLLGLSPDLRGPLQRGPSLDLVASRHLSPQAQDRRLVIEPDQPVAHIGSAAGKLPYFPTGPPLIT